MADLLLDSTHDRFVVMYDIIQLINENLKSESSIISAIHLSSGIISQLLAFIIDQGYIRITDNDSEFRITGLGSSFLKEFQGMRRFLS